MTSPCRLCKGPGGNTAIDPTGDMRFVICDRCIETHHYFRCCQCDFHYAIAFKRDEPDGATCVYCTGEQDWPFYEEVEL